MNAKISVFVICVETIMYLLLYDLPDCTFKQELKLKRILTKSTLAQGLTNYCDYIVRLHKIGRMRVKIMP